MFVSKITRKLLFSLIKDRDSAGHFNFGNLGFTKPKLSIGGCIDDRQSPRYNYMDTFDVFREQQSRTPALITDVNDSTSQRPIL